MNVPFLDLAAASRELREELLATSRDVIDSGRYVLGPRVEAFEREFARYVEANHAVGVGSGLDALELALRALAVGPGDEVVVPAFTFIATWLAVGAVGATVVPVETQAGSFDVDPAALTAALTERTKAAILVHLYGHPTDLDVLEPLLRERGVALIEDAAQCHGARLGGRRIGARGELVCWSFYPGKNLGALGDAGAITTDSADLAEAVRRLRNYGSTQKYVHEVAGRNSRLDELQAAWLSIKLKHLDAWNQRRRQIAARYRAALAGTPGLTLPTTRPGAEPVWHLFVVRVRERDRIQAQLAERGVQTLVHYPIPIHLQAAYAGLGLGEGAFPVTEALQRELLSLPIGPHMHEDQVAHVIASVKAVLGDGS